MHLERAVLPNLFDAASALEASQHGAYHHTPSPCNLTLHQLSRPPMYLSPMHWSFECGHHASLPQPPSAIFVDEVHPLILNKTIVVGFLGIHRSFRSVIRVRQVRY
ncbi:hypothetical protein P691DRAFT_802330 [Macrolepiota fuliginosa MF-IS2]|uniref:Uncharacterized protein n=1 Tax=Macrolepiota fuliginosa MF-IS2 TaxID=1400762 RepID=A0A9P5WX06_9AGAR|nr:hypothetical protein P691DRAFT_802545 [Macrolepiota fuliginosa MF-IS2]KAF9440428.1 hypothetical protein P691DRAFT_802330 [Macrolepiota fuliginosa MF-IS2]